MTDDRITRKALLKYQIVSAFLAQDPPRGKKRELLEHLAAKTWFDESGGTLSVKPETIRYWLRQYRNNGFEALKDKKRADRGIRAIAPELIEKACRLKLEVPERSIERIIAIMENLQMAPPGVLRRSTLHRALKKRGLSTRKLKTPDKKDLDRFAADFANDLWQSDMLFGPYLPDPGKPGKMKRTFLYAFLDDASRLLLYGRFFFKGDLPALELVFKRSLQRYGRPKRVYYDNGLVYRANHMRLVCAELGVHRPIYTTPYRPMGHGKIEAFNRLCTSSFIAEVKASRILTLEQLNAAFMAWVEQEYNRRRHSELGMSPKQRWMKDAGRAVYLDEEKLRVSFLWREYRTPDKAGVLRLFSNRYKVLPQLAGKRLEVRYDPENLDRIEIHHDGKFRQKAGPLVIQPERAPKTLPEMPEKPLPRTDYLGWLTTRHQNETAIEAARDHTPAMNLLQKKLAPEVWDETLANDFFDSIGTVTPNKLERIMDDLLSVHPANLHLSFYLEHIRELS